MIGTANPLIDRMRVYDPQVDSDRLERAFELVQPSVSPQDEQRYRRLAERLRRTRAEGKSGGESGSAGGAPTAAAGRSSFDGVRCATTS